MCDKCIVPVFNLFYNTPLTKFGFSVLMVVISLDTRVPVFRDVSDSSFPLSFLTTDSRGQQDDSVGLTDHLMLCIGTKLVAGTHMGWLRTACDSSLGRPNTSSDFYRYPHLCVYKHKHTEIHISQNKIQTITIHQFIIMLPSLFLNTSYMASCCLSLYF